MKKTSMHSVRSDKKALFGKQLAALFKKFRVQFAYQFGSTVTGHATANSDLDIAVFLPERLSELQRFNLRLRLAGELERFFKKNVDLVVLNDIQSLFFKYTIIHEGKLIYDSGACDFADYTVRIIGQYFDFAPFLDQYNKAYVERNLQ